MLDKLKYIIWLFKYERYVILWDIVEFLVFMGILLVVFGWPILLD